MLFLMWLSFMVLLIFRRRLLGPILGIHYELFECVLGTLMAAWMFSSIGQMGVLAGIMGVILVIGVIFSSRKWVRLMEAQAAEDKNGTGT